MPENERQSDRSSYGGTYEYVGSFDLGLVFVFYEQNPYDDKLGQSRLYHYGDHFIIVVSRIAVIEFVFVKNFNNIFIIIMIIKD